jgi:hypothetical protein
VTDRTVHLPRKSIRRSSAVSSPRIGSTVYDASIVRQLQKMKNGWPGARTSSSGKQTMDIKAEGSKIIREQIGSFASTSMWPRSAASSHRRWHCPIHGVDSDGRRDARVSARRVHGA